MQVTDELRLFAGWWRAARHVVVFTGAGMSTESGLPDFRSTGGLWRASRRFEELASSTALQRWPDEFDEFYRFRMQQLAQHSPHAGHAVLSRLQAAGHLQALITQNVDGFHEHAGSTGVLCLHGTLRSVFCQACGKQADAAAYVAGSSRCACGGKLRPSVVLFGENLNPHTLEAAALHSQSADLFVVLGSSLAVSPANTLPQLAKGAGAKLVIVNRDATPLHARADLCFDAAIGELLSNLEPLI